MVNQSFQGMMRYDNEPYDHVDVMHLVLRPGALAIDFASDTSQHGRWEASATLLEISNDHYSTTGIWAARLGVPCSDSWTVSLTLRLEQDGQLAVQGSLIEKNSTFGFAGILSPVSPPHAQELSGANQLPPEKRLQRRNSFDEARELTTSPELTTHYRG